MDVQDVTAVDAAQIKVQNSKKDKVEIENSKEITIPIGKNSSAKENSLEFDSNKKILDCYSDGTPMKVQITDTKGNIKILDYDKNGEIDSAKYVFKNPDRKSVIEIGNEKLPIYDIPIGTEVNFRNKSSYGIEISVPDDKTNFLPSSMIIGDINGETQENAPITTNRTININLVKGKDINIGFGNKDNFNLIVFDDVTVNKLVVHPDSKRNVSIENRGFIKDIVTDKSNDEIINYPCGTIHNLHLGRGKNSIENFKGNIEGDSDTSITEKNMFDFVGKIAANDGGTLESTCNLGFVHFGKVTHNSECSSIKVNELDKTLEVEDEDLKGNIRTYIYDLTKPNQIDCTEESLQDKHGVLIGKKIRTESPNGEYTVTSFEYPKDSLMVNKRSISYDKNEKIQSVVETENFSLTNFPGYWNKAWSEFPHAFSSAFQHYVLENSH